MIGLSKSALDVFKDCPKCFYLEKIGKLKRPAGIKASIMNGIDDCMKQVADYAVANKKAAVYLSELKGAKPFHDRQRLAKFMNWRSFQATVQAGPHQVLIWGQLDDLIEWPNGDVSPWDFKSNGKNRQWDEYTAQYNSLQADMYDILLAAQGLKPNGDSYFTYSWPVVVKGIMGFDHKTVLFKTDRERAIEVLAKATECLLGSKAPDASPNCEYCLFTYQRGLA